MDSTSQDQQLQGPPKQLDIDFGSFVQQLDAELLHDELRLEQRVIPDFVRLAEIVAAHRTLGNHIVITSGSFDISHIGHYRYLLAARLALKAASSKAILIVGVDSDEKIRKRKGEERPVVPEEERVEDLLFQTSSVDYVFLKHVDHPRWEFVRTVRPDVVIATAETYTQEEIEELEADYCGKVLVLPPMAVTTTSARLRKIQVGLAAKIGSAFAKEAPAFVERVIDEVLGGKK